MKKLILMLPLIALAGCASNGMTDRKAPCDGKTAYLGENPCNPLPINISSILQTSLKKDV